MNTYTKQSADVIDIDIDYSEYLPSDDVVSTASAECTSGLTLGETSLIPSSGVVKQWISGGVSGGIYDVAVTMTSTQGRVKKWDFRVRVKDQ